MRPAKPIEVGERFGRLRFLAALGYRNGRAWASFECDCGKIVERRVNDVRGGKTSSCGCLFQERLRATGRANRTHGHGTPGRQTRTYRSWQGMKKRCANPNDPSYPDYGGRGITVCDRWQSFENFLADMGERPEGRTLDRIDNDGGYEPSNCRWATPLEQRHNRRAPS